MLVALALLRGIYKVYTQLHCMSQIQSLPNGQLWTPTAVATIFHPSLLQHPEPPFLYDFIT